MEQGNRTRGIDIVKDQLLDEGPYSELRVQITLDNAVLKQYHTITLNAWDKVEQHEKDESFTKTTQVSKKCHLHS